MARLWLPVPTGHGKCLDRVSMRHIARSPPLPLARIPVKRAAFPILGSLAAFLIQCSVAWPPSLPVRCPAPDATRNSYFAFASDGRMTPALIEKLAATGPRPILGFDLVDLAELEGEHGECSPVSFTTEGAGLLKLVRARKADVHVYLEGPGGPTGANNSKPDLDEQRRILWALQCEMKGRPDVEVAWKRYNDAADATWRGGVWWSRTMRQLQGLEGAADTVEIDNLYRDDLSRGRLDVFLTQQYLPYWKKRRDAGGAPPRLVLKNLTAEDWGKLVGACQAAPATRAAFADFAIAERESEADRGGTLAWTLGIRLLVSTSTERYSAHGCYSQSGAGNGR